jgi:hypothetical protein
MYANENRSLGEPGEAPKLKPVIMNSKTIVLFFTVFITSYMAAYSQSLEEMLAEEIEEVTSYTSATFKATRILNGHSIAMTEHGFIGNTTGNWLNGDIHFGFNISRVFNLKK